MSSQESDLGVHLVAHVITQRLDTMMNAFPALGGLFMYSSKDAAWVERFADNAYPYSVREAIRTMIRTEENWKNSLGRWHVQPVAGENMLMISLKYDAAYMIALVDLKRLLSVTEETYRLYFMDESGSAISGGAFAMPKKVAQLPEGCCEAAGADGENYMAVWSSLSRVPVRLLLAVSDAGYWEGLTPVQICMLVLSLAMVGMIPLARRWVRASLGEPLEDLSSAMERIKRGELDEPIQREYEMVELDQVKSTLNDMMGQIRTLKIEAYEREMDRQRIEMQCLHMQLRPHFFLNCLKNIYACAQRLRYQQVQEMALAVSDYIRYLFRDNMKMVTLREELRYVKNYIEIQRLCLSMPPRCNFSVDESLMELPVPPLFVESFVENAVKHQWKPDRQLVIPVRVVELKAEDGRYLDITVHDNGDGFAQDVLEQINNLPEESFYREYHVGLTNLKHRLRLIYGGRAALAFYNDVSGAVCEVICPLDTDDETEKK